MTRHATIVLFPLIAILVFPQVGATPPSMTLDGQVSSGACESNGTCTLTLSTANPEDVIVLVAQCVAFLSCNATISSVSDSDGHTWTLRAVYTPSREIWEYYTIANSPLSSDRITVNWSGSGGLEFAAFGVSGANTRHPWDPSPRLPLEEAASSSICYVNSQGFTICNVTFSAVGAQDFVIVSTAVNDDQVCQVTLPLRI
ncbi:hypothetical protein E6H14_03260 [Candidatus Bathyarchaeota archaeon]|nr:MAG: hypothetical protein E6H14_03260 [Candidatus Bathyarchaeota archaeon]